MYFRFQLEYISTDFRKCNFSWKRMSERKVKDKYDLVFTFRFFVNFRKRRNRHHYLIE